MNELNIPQHVVQSIGWTLIHSLWQGLLIFGVLRLAVRLTNRSDLRYGLGVGALLLMIVASATTFLILDQHSAGTNSFNLVAAFQQPSVSGQNSASILASALNWIDTNIIWLIRFWMFGFVIGLVRIAAGLWYINRLRRNSHPVQDEWAQMVNSLSLKLNINRVVAMAEAGITSPMVVGFIKPMILFPFGLLAGLTPEQVETILVHELSHVRRQDYLINLFQAIVETIFFFNPFVILISSLIREERENCCDDMVIAKGISPISYVRTLAQLEASRASSPLALGISGNKNQLLNRIKRIMENSAKNDWGKGRLVPVALVFLGLICASWLSIGSEAEMKETNTSYLTKISKHTTASDTSREDGLKVIKSNKHKAQEEIDRIERFEFDTDEFEMPPMPDIHADFDMDMAMDVFDNMPAIEVPPADFGFPALRDGDWNVLRFDSLPGFRFRMRDNPEEFERFEKEFTQKFREEFKEFYEKNHEQLEEMMREIEKERRDAAEVVDLDQMRLRAKIESDRARISADKIRQDLLLRQDIPGAMIAPRPFREFQDLPALQEPLKILDGKIALQKDMFDEMARNFDAYQNEVTALLIEDGYLDKGESIENLTINDDGGDLTINGKKIKEKDQLKYRALHDKYFQPRYERDGYHRRQE